MGETYRFLKRTLGEDQEKWTWGNQHQTVIQHLSGLKPLAVGPFPWGGSPYSINTSHDIGTQDFGVSSRMIAVTGDLPYLLINFPGGVSSNPVSDRYLNFMELWKNGRYWKVSL